LRFSTPVGYGLNDRRAVVLNCSAAIEIYPTELLSDWGQSLYDLGSQITLQTGGGRGAG
jgi:hypothetical protein